MLNPEYIYEMINDPVFTFKIIRRSNGRVIFDTSLGKLHKMSVVGCCCLPMYPYERHDPTVRIQALLVSRISHLFSFYLTQYIVLSNSFHDQVEPRIFYTAKSLL